MPRYRFAIEGHDPAPEVAWLPDDVAALRLAAEVTSDLSRNRHGNFPIVIAVRQSSKTADGRQAAASLADQATDGPATGELPASRKIDAYQRDREICEAGAAKASSRELRRVWRTMAASYDFLIELEARPRYGLCANAKRALLG